MDIYVINPFKPNGISHYYQLDQFFSVLRVVGRYFSYLSANSGNPDQTPHFAASDLGLHYLPMSHKKDASLKSSADPEGGTGGPDPPGK